MKKGSTSSEFKETLGLLSRGLDPKIDSSTGGLSRLTDPVSAGTLITLSIFMPLRSTSPSLGIRVATPSDSVLLTPVLKLCSFPLFYSGVKIVFYKFLIEP